ncbi:enoyl-CoA hydratase [Usitatibacter palustris]|uniref:Enoyl-CoA hydratase domain-containing protein 3, mitochondrial n=1 Tax=Usitatibacter palustris TaxID=2732487 RepID=A0A6M4H6E7_9PROT|nr:enoyl-CoA hydratase [Usitatibacter palustris]QJR14912.1 2,3-dehydroadipyl-CoA hydratase [Usitatibacter palustris]
MSELLVSVDDGIATLTLNRPRQYNALSSALLGALDSELDRIAGDEAVRVVIITGAGASFCSGHDLKEMRAASQEEVQRLFATCSAFMQKLTALPQPVIAAVNGLATAAGCQLIAQCDLAVANEHARFAVSGVNLGLFCSTPAVALSRNISRKRAAEMLFTGEFIEAATALDWGLVNRVAPADRLMETTRELANNLKAKPRASLALGKALFYRQLEAQMRTAYDDASRTIAANMAEGDAQEGVDAFLEKRPPNWKS